MRNHEIPRSHPPVGVAVVVGYPRTDFPPQVLESRGRSGEVNTRKTRICQHDIGNRKTVSGHHVDDTGRQTGRLQQLHRVVRGEGLGDRRLPYHRVSHQGWRGRQIPAIAVKLKGVTAWTNPSSGR